MSFQVCKACHCSGSATARPKSEASYVLSKTIWVSLDKLDEM